MTDFNINVPVDDGKYRILQHPGGGVEILRHGQSWMGGPTGSFPGVNCIIAMACELEELRARPVPDAAVQVADEAFRAGFQACLQTARDSGSLQDGHVAPGFWVVAEQLAWGTFEPSEAVKDLLR